MSNAAVSEQAPFKLHHRFDRAARLLGESAMQRLAASHVVVFGLGGVGSWASEAGAKRRRAHHARRLRSGVRLPVPWSYESNDNDFHTCDHRTRIDGTASFVTASFGMAAAGVAVRGLSGK